MLSLLGVLKLLDLPLEKWSKKLEDNLKKTQELEMEALPLTITNVLLFQPQPLLIIWLDLPPSSF
jgi:hypothetical protein